MSVDMAMWGPFNRISAFYKRSADRQTLSVTIQSFNNNQTETMVLFFSSPNDVLPEVSGFVDTLSKSIKAAMLNPNTVTASVLVEAPARWN